MNDNLIFVIVSVNSFWINLELGETPVDTAWKKKSQIKYKQVHTKIL